MSEHESALQSTRPHFHIAGGTKPADKMASVAIFSDRLETICRALLTAPALPTLLPGSAESVCNFARALADERFPAIELMNRPMHELIPLLQSVIQRPERTDVYWGIGTVRTRSEALAIAELKPDFMVSPAFSRRVFEVALERGIPYVPAVSSFQDVQNVIDAFDECGLVVRMLKLCPANFLPPAYIQGLIGCYPGITFCPTGDISMDNYSYWVNMPGIAAPMGSQLVPRPWIESLDSDAIRKRLRLIRELWDARAPNIP